MDPDHQSKPQSGEFQSTSLSSTCFNLEPGHSYSTKPDTLGQPPSRNQPLEIYGQQMSSKHSHPLLEARITAFSNNDYDRAAPPRSSNSRGQRICFPSHCSDDSMRPLDNPESYRSTGANTDDHIFMPHGVIQRRRHYADDFVRTIDSRDTIPMEYSLQHRRTDCARKPVIQSTYVRLPQDPYKHTVSGSISSSLPPVQGPPDARLRPVAHGYTVVDKLGMGYQDAMFVESAPAVGCYEGRFQSSTNSSRYGSEQLSIFLALLPPFSSS
jgi:hypothetical protein